MTLAAAHATLAALTAATRPRPARAARLGDAPARLCGSGNASLVSTRRARGATSRALEGDSGDLATDIQIPDTFRPPPPPGQLRGAEKHMFPPVGVADDPTLANPLERLNRLGAGWFGCVFELEGVLVKARDAEHRASWMRLAKERDEPPPPEMVLKFASTTKPETFISRHLRWTRDPMEMRRMNERRAEIYREILDETGDAGEELLPGVLSFLELLRQSKVPMAVTCGTKTFAQLRDACERLDILRFFENPDSPVGEPRCVGADDVSDWLPDPMPIERACELMGRPPTRTVVFGDNTTVTEACYEARAKSVLLLGRQPRYELQGADAVLTRLTDYSYQNLKQLFSEEQSEAAEPEREKVEIFPTNFGATQTYAPEPVPEAEGDDAGGREPPNYANRRRRRDL